MISTRCSLVYTTTATREQARSIARFLIDQRLAACVNILGEIESFYEWKGTSESAPEVALIAKTATSLTPKLMEALKKRHPYECPCIVCIDIADGYRPFLEWIEAQTQPKTALEEKIHECGVDGRCRS